MSYENERQHDYCPSASPFVWTDDLIENQRTILKTRCKRWDCPYCAEVNRLQHRLKVYHGLSKLESEGHQFDFVTWTSHKNLKDTKSCYKVFQKAWTKLSTRYRRAAEKVAGISPEYVFIPELHKDGRMHWHGCFTGHLSSRWWKDNCAETGFGFMAKSVRLESVSQGANYCLKYISKSMGQSVDIARFRRINYSRGFPPNIHDKTEIGWMVLEKTESIVALIESAWSQDLSVTLNRQLIEEILTD